MTTTRSLSAHRLSPAVRSGLRFGIAGVVLLLVSVIQLVRAFTATTASSTVGAETLQLGIAAAGVGLVVAGFAQASRR